MTDNLQNVISSYLRGNNHPKLNVGSEAATSRATLIDSRYFYNQNDSENVVQNSGESGYVGSKETNLEPIASTLDSTSVTPADNEQPRLSEHEQQNTNTTNTSSISALQRAQMLRNHQRLSELSKHSNFS